jgi:hypothetical protein
LDRDNKAPFREDVLTNAEEQAFEYVKELFYLSGRIEPIPKHYEFIGVVERFWERVDAVGVRMEASILTRGDRIAFKLPVEFEEQAVQSLQKEQLKKGTRVFRLRQL